MDALVVRTGTANLASVVAGLERVGARPRVTQDADAVHGAPRVVLPGVGTLDAAMTSLRKGGLDEAVSRRVGEGRPTLAVCLGLQILASGSEESPDEEGLGILSGRVTRFAEGVRVPQLGWNRVEAGEGCRLIESGWAYFANSYKLDEVPAGWRGALSDHGGPFVAAIERGDVLACQFHPELSGAWGLALLERWLGGASC